MTPRAPVRFVRRPLGRRFSRSTGGFLLLEALVAVGIMAFVLSVLPSGIIIARKSVQGAANVVGARLVAESVLVNEFTGPAMTPGTNSGTLDGYDWATLVQPNPELTQAFPSRQWTPFNVTVQVLVPNGPKITLQTIRLGRGR